MDGTLTVPAIDFPAMYRAVLGEDEYLRIRAENPSGIDILHQIENWSPEKQRKAYDTIADYERQGLDRLQIMPGMESLVFVNFGFCLFGEKILNGKWKDVNPTFFHFGKFTEFCLLKCGSGAAELCGFLDSKRIRSSFMFRVELVVLFYIMGSWVYAYVNGCLSV